MARPYWSGNLQISLRNRVQGGGSLPPNQGPQKPAPAGNKWGVTLVDSIPTEAARPKRKSA
jgi:hypothetical protein